MSDKGTINLALNLNDENVTTNTDEDAIELTKLAKSSDADSVASDHNDTKNVSLDEKAYNSDEPADVASVEAHIGDNSDSHVGNEVFSVKASDPERPPNHSLCIEEDSPNMKRWKSGPLDSKDPGLNQGVQNGDVDAEVKYKKSEKRSPFDRAFFFSKYFTFWWLQNLFSLGNKKVLEPSDLFELPSNDRTDKWCEKFEREWNKEAYDSSGNLNKNASLMKVVFRVFGFKYMLVGIVALTENGFRLASPIFLGFLTSYFVPNSTTTSRDAYLYGLGLVVSTFLMALHNLPMNFVKQRFGMRARIALSSMVYKKVLRLSNSALASTTTGHIVNLVSVDVQKFDFFALFLHYLWIGPIVVIITGYLVWREIGISSLAGVGLLLLLAPLQLVMGRLLIKFRRDVVKFTDKRVKIIHEIITGIRIIKMYTWEEPFTKIVDELRTKEIHATRKLSYLRATFLSFFFSSGALVSFVTFMTYALTGNVLTASKVFTCVALFNNGRLVMTLLFPLAVTMINEVKVSIERIQKLLLMDEISAPGLEKSNLRPKAHSSSVIVENLHASWTKKAKTLEDINLDVGQGELAAIVGPVGCGKSSLLMAILGELCAEQGSVKTVGKVAYVSQEAWIFNGTLKNNITFGQELDEKRYRKVIHICALEKDIEQLPQGDLTLVGERGVSLSGGQKARVNLARAVYFNADIYILDDPLSAVDAHVGRHLFNECISGFLSNKVRILVTHQLQYLADANQILVLSEGKTLAKGTYSYLQSHGINFVNLLKTEDEPQDDQLDEETIRERSFSRQFSIPKNDEIIKLRSGTRTRKISQGSIVAPEDLGSDVSIASNVAKVEEFEEKEIPNEKKLEGIVTWRSYLEFFRAGYSLVIWGLLMLLFAVCQGIFVVTDWWLSYWTTEEEKSGKQTNRDRNLGIYAALVIVVVSLGIGRAILFFFAALKSSKVLHGLMLRSALRAPIRFYDTNSIGRILNRFSKDMNLVDDRFSFVFFDFVQTALVVCAIVLLVCVSNPVVFAIALPIVILFFILRQYHIKTAREVKRIEGLYRSPVFGHLSTTLLGLPIIRAFQVQQKFTEFFFQYQDEHTKSWIIFLGCGSWLSIRLELLSTIFISFVVFVSIALRDKLGLTSGQVGLMLTYTITLIGVLQQCVRQSTEVENNMTAVERVLEYTQLDSEAPPETDTKPPVGWPQRGSIRLKRMTFAYAANLPNVLKGVTAHIKSNEKIGICGRTGAGKSSLLSTLFRTCEPKGEIIIDGINVLELGLKDLRSKISIIPQDPVLFSGTLRRNLDPFSHYSDYELWNVLEEVQLKEAVEAMPEKLLSEMAESGQNLSVGQRQLVCLARAILKRNKILVIDEATANVDPITDALIQTTIREKFKDCTVLTIAHRLNTIMDSDRIMVLDAGKVKEFDQPYNLLRRKNSVLYQLVKQTGHSEAQNLFDNARKAFEAKDTTKINELIEKENATLNQNNAGSTLVQKDGVQFNVSIEITDTSMSQSDAIEEHSTSSKDDDHTAL